MKSTLNRTSRLAKIVGAGASLVLAGVAAAQFGTESSGGRSSVPPPPPAPPAPVAIAAPPAGGSSSSFNMVVNDNGRTIKLEMKDNVVTHAEVDGKTIPDSQIENDGGTVRLKDEKGEVLYETQVGGGAMFGGEAMSGFEPDDPAWRGLLRIAPRATSPGHARSITLLGHPGLGTTSTLEPQASTLWTEPAETPAVMIGVQLGVPDSTLCGHLGIERNKSTLLTAVHEGLPAAAAGLEPYDLIVSVGGKDEAAPAAVRGALKDKKAGDTIALGVIHKGVRKDVSLTVEAFDRKKLADSKVHAISSDGENDEVFAIASNPFATPTPPLPPSIPEEYRKQIEQYFKENSAPRAQTFRFKRNGGAADPGMSQRLLAEIERSQQEAAHQADQAAKRAHELVERLHEQAPAAAADMQDRMKRMEEMLEKMMQEKLNQPKPQEPAGKDAGSRS